MYGCVVDRETGLRCEATASEPRLTSPDEIDSSVGLNVKRTELPDAPPLVVTTTALGPAARSAPARTGETKVNDVSEATLTLVPAKPPTVTDVTAEADPPS